MTWSDAERLANRHRTGADAGRPLGSGGRRMDWVVVELACSGQLPPQMSSAERREAVRRLTAQGLSANAIAKRLRLSWRTVQRHRAALAREG
jgi:DNA-binding NarL/FixJ family response regulator